MMKALLISGLFLTGALHSAISMADDNSAWRVNSERLNKNLQAFGKVSADVSKNTSRLAYSDTDLAGRVYIMERMRAAGLYPEIDRAGNIIGKRAGKDASLPVIMLGSHSDSVPNGGLYDGPVGVWGAIEVAHTLKDKNHITNHPLEFVVFQNEEGGKTGSRLITGGIMDKEFGLSTASGKTIGEGIVALGGNLKGLANAKRKPGSIKAFFELHIEQGAILDAKNIPIGIVQGIVGIKRWNITVDGFTNHAGTTPMDQRADALLAAAKLIDAINQNVTSLPGQQVGTVGKVQAFPGAANVVPGKAILSLEIRDLSMEKIDKIFALIEDSAKNIEEKTKTTISFDHIYISQSALTHKSLKTIITDSAQEMGLKTLDMPSGAGHDAQSIAKIAPIGMIFVPSRDGISHSPKEYTAPDQITNGANVLLQSLLKIDQGR
jgi:N-carbamoyl-L-amino-acid hydrolase